MEPLSNTERQSLKRPDETGVVHQDSAHRVKPRATVPSFPGRELASRPDRLCVSFAEETSVVL